MHLTVTGHRPDRLGGYGDDARDKLEGFAIHVVRQTGATSVRIGGALGWDQACGWAAVALGVPFDIVEPGFSPTLPPFYARWPAPSRERYLALRGQAASVTVRPWAGAGREYSDRDWALLDDPCELVAALWCGEASGTGMTVDMARRRKRPVWNFCEEWTRWDEHTVRQ